MAVAFDAVSTPTGGQGSTTPLQWNHTCAANATAILIAATTLNLPSNDVTSVTYGGQTCSLLAYEISGGSGTTVGGIGLYYLANPPTGSNQVSIAFTGGSNTIAGAISVTGSIGHGTTVTGFQSSSATSCTAVVNGTTTGGLIVPVACFGGGAGSGTFSGTNSVTVQWQKTGSTSSGADNAAGGTVASTGGGANQTVGFSNTQSDIWGMVAVELLPSFVHADSASTQATSAVATISATLAGAVNAGDLLVLGTGCPAPLASGDVTDSAGNTWYVAESTSFGGIAYCLSSAAAPGGLTVTVAHSGSSGTRALAVDRFTVASGYHAIFGAAEGSTTAISTTSFNLGSLTGVSTGELLWGYLHTDTSSLTFTAGSSNSIAAVIGTQLSNGSGSVFTEYIYDGAGGTESLTATASAAPSTSPNYGMATFTAAAGVAPAPPAPYTGTDWILKTQAIPGQAEPGNVIPGQVLLSTTPGTPVLQPGSKTWRRRFLRRQQPVLPNPPSTFSTYSGAFTAGITAQDTIGGTKTGFGALTATITAQDTLAGKKTGFTALTAAITAQNSLAGKKTAFRAITAAVTALMSAAGTKTAKGVLTTTVTAQDSIAGTKTAKGVLTAAVTAQDSFAGTKTAKGVLTVSATAVMTAAGKRTQFAAITAGGTALMSAAGTKTAFGHLTTTATAQAVFAGTKTAFGSLAASITALFSGNATAAAAPGTPLLQRGSRTWRSRFRRKQRFLPLAFAAPVTSDMPAVPGHLSPGADTPGGTFVVPPSHFNGAFAAAATAHAAFTGTKTGSNSGAVTITITAQGSLAGTKTAFGHLTATVTAAMSAAGRKTGFGHLTTTATVQAVLGGVKTAFGHFAASATVQAFLNGINASVRNPRNLGGTVIELFFSGTSSEVANQYGGTLTQNNYGGGLLTPNYGGTNGVVVNNLGGTISGPALGGTLGMVNYGGGAVGWTMQKVDQNFPEFNDITLNVSLTSNGSALNLTGYTVNMIMKPVAGVLDSDGRNILLSSAGGSPAITITNAAAGTCNVAIANADVQDQTHTFYRIDAVDGSGHINTCVYGTITYTAL